MASFAAVESGQGHAGDAMQPDATECNIKPIFSAHISLFVNSFLVFVRCQTHATIAGTGETPVSPCWQRWALAAATSVVATSSALRGWIAAERLLEGLPPEITDRT
jgi:hypothetical protein